MTATEREERQLPPGGFKLLGQHREGCWSADDEDGMTFVVHDGTEWDRDRIGRKGGSTMWHRFRCNDPNCKAVTIVRWDVLSRFVTAGSRTEGSS